MQATSWVSHQMLVDFEFAVMTGYYLKVNMVLHKWASLIRRAHY